MLTSFVIGAVVLAASGPCEPEWSNLFAQPGVYFPSPTSGFNNRSLSFIQLDPDGNGPLPNTLVIGGGFWKNDLGDPADGVVGWDGHQWVPFGSGLASNVWSLGVFDFDGDGPDPARLVAGGGFELEGSSVARYVAKWDGAQWTSLDAGLEGYLDDNRRTYVLDFQAFDDDGDGPDAPALYAAGLFYRGNDEFDGLLKWDGAQWTPVGNATSGAASDLAVFDPDGAGPEPARLYVAGIFELSDGSSLNGLVSWDGTSFRQEIPNDRADYVYHIEPFDPDGAGPLPKTLFLSGEFPDTGIPPEPNVGVAIWDGAALTRTPSYNWFGDISGPPIYGITLQAATVMVGGVPTPTMFAGNVVDGSINDGLVRRWTGSAWTPIPSGFGSYLGSFDVDGPAGPRLILGGSAGGPATIPVPANMVVGWDGEQFSSIGVGGGLNGEVEDGALITPEPARASEPDLLAVGSFSIVDADGIPSNGIARWDGTRWHAYATAPRLPGPLWKVIEFDADGDGSDPPRVFVGGSFRASTSSNAPSVSGLLMWDGTSWTDLNPDLPGVSHDPFKPYWFSVTAMGVFDLDGDGPGQPALYLAGHDLSRDAREGIDSASHVFRWDGATWTQLGDSIPAYQGWFRDLTLFDPDGDGPASPMLAAAGGVTETFGGADIWPVAVWNGSTWSSLGSLTGVGSAVTPFDPDPNDGQPPVLVAAVDQGNNARRVLAWNGSTWSQLGPDSSNYVQRLGVVPAIDPIRSNGAQTLVASEHSNLRRWTGAEWEPAGVSGGGVNTFLPIPNTDDVYLLGRFSLVATYADRTPSSYVARWSPTNARPFFYTQPVAPPAPDPGVTASVTAKAAPGATVSYRWRLDGEPLTDSGMFSGTLTSTLLFTPTDYSQGPFDVDCVATTACGTATSNVAHLYSSLPPPVYCAADANGDGFTNMADFAIVVSNFGQPGAYHKSTGDFNGDQTVNVFDFSILASDYGCEGDPR